VIDTGASHIHPTHRDADIPPPRNQNRSLHCQIGGQLRNCRKRSGKERGLNFFKLQDNIYKHDLLSTFYVQMTNAGNDFYHFGTGHVVGAPGFYRDHRNLGSHRTTRISALMPYPGFISNQASS